jgi:hypothetical protein
MQRFWADVAVARVQVRSGSIGGGWAFAPKAMFGYQYSELKRENIRMKIVLD